MVERIDFSALQTPDYFGNSLKALQQGRQDQAVLAKQNALKAYAVNPDEGIRQLMAVDPASAVTLQKAQAEQRQQASAEAAGRVAATGDLEGAGKIAGAAGNFDLMSKIQGMSKAQRDQASEAFDKLHSAYLSVRQYPYEQRHVMLQQKAPELVALGVPQQAIDNFDPTDQNIDSGVQTALGIKGQIDQGNKDREFKLEGDKFGYQQKHDAATLGETSRHNKVDEGLGGAKLHEEIRHNKASEDPGDGLDPNSIDYVAQQYILTGNMPPLGMGKQAAAMRQQIIQRAAGIEKETGATGADAVQRHATVKAASASLQKITGLRSQIEASERTVNDNAAFALSLAPKGGGPTGSPMLNAPIQALRNRGLGDPNVSAFNNAIGTVADEYAKVMTSNTGSGGSGTSDSARKEAYDRLSKSATFAQLQSNVAAMRTEMANRLKSLRQQESSLSDSIKSGGKTAPPPVDDAAPQRLSPAQAMKLAPGTKFVGMDGVERVRH